MTPLYIFDLDGTLALIEHRLHYVADGRKNWDSFQAAFHAACVDDVPNTPVIGVLNALRKAGAECWIWSGRDDSVRVQTVEWLQRNGCFGSPRSVLWAWPFMAVDRFRMRPHGDHQLDVTLKRGWLHAMAPADRARLQAVFDDRSRLVKMWREEGVPCFQVAEGDF